jgi:hypothetical protein
MEPGDFEVPQKNGEIMGMYGEFDDICMIFMMRIPSDFTIKSINI